MKLGVLSRVALYIVGITWSSAPIVSAAQSCKCPRNPGPGGGVQCAANQIATCDPSSGECNCTCDSAQPGKTKADYEAQIFSKVLHAKVEPDDLSSPQYQKFVSTFRKSDGDKGTFRFDKEPGGSQGRQIQIGVPGWLEEVLEAKGGVSVGPGAALQNCPNGNCSVENDNGTKIYATSNAPNSAVSVGQKGGITAGRINIDAAEHLTLNQESAGAIGHLSVGTCPIQMIGIRAVAANDETGKFAEDLKDAVKLTGMDAKTGYLLMAPGPNGPLRRGVTIDAGDDCLAFANNLAGAMVNNFAVSGSRMLVNRVTSREWKDKLAVLVTSPN